MKKKRKNGLKDHKEGNSGEMGSDIIDTLDQFCVVHVCFNESKEIN